MLTEIHSSMLLRVKKLLIQVDNKRVVEMRQGAEKVPQFGYNMIHHTQHLGKNFEDIKVEHIFREANRSADLLAKQGNNGCNNTFDVSHRRILPLIIDDLSVSFIRL